MSATEPAVVRQGEPESVKQGLDDIAQHVPSPGTGRGARSAGRGIARAFGYLVLIVAAIGLLIPFFWTISSALKPANDVFTVPVQWLPQTWKFDNFIDVWTKVDLLTWFRNTLLLAVVVTILQVLTGSLAAYGFARMKFRGRDALFIGYIATIAVPWQSYMITQFILVSKMGLANTLWAIILLQAFSAFGVFLMKQYYETIPEELSEAARIDGLSEYGIWRRIMLPLSTPAIASLVLLTFVTVWNDYLGPLIYLRNPDLWTIQLGLQTLVSNQFEADYGLMFAGLVVSMIPIAIVFVAGQKYFIEGIATSGMKG
ncbi:MAG TPA: carbohydrate ABC transporter permease [Candidatus Lumbricidophila sp.]|nr:carbohydrate ABC transporter permease [Candidatus Lumbricidophila sp.]